MSKTVKCLALAFAGALLAAAPDTAGAGGLVQYSFNIANFSHPLSITNRYFPLAPGRRIVYYEFTRDECIVNDFVVSSQTKSFKGAYTGLVARVILDKSWLDRDCDGNRDVLLEDTKDWYAQDNAGNVWYFGEDTIEYQFDANGNPAGSSKFGSWEAGIDGARAGLIMLVNPQIGQYYQQEYYAGVAEDKGKVAALNASVSIGLGDFTGCVVTKEWSPLDTGAIERKSYCPNIGLLLVEEVGMEPGGAEAVKVSMSVP